MRAQVEQIVNDLPRVANATGQVNISPDTSRLLNLCDKYAQQTADKYISSELFLLAACEDSGALARR